MNQNSNPDRGLSFQERVGEWMQECFGPEISANRQERGDRLLEEVLELLQSGGYPKDRVAQLVDYVYGRPAGDPAQEVGGVRVTLSAYCTAHYIQEDTAAEAELARILQPDIIQVIRSKQAAKVRSVGAMSPLPQASEGLSLQLEAPTGLPARAWTEGEHESLRDAVGTIIEAESVEAAAYVCTTPDSEQEEASWPRVTPPVDPVSDRFAGVIPLEQLADSWRDEADRIGKPETEYKRGYHMALSWCAKELDRAQLLSAVTSAAANVKAYAESVSAQPVTGDFGIEFPDIRPPLNVNPDPYWQHVKGWWTPSIMSFKNVVRTNCPPELREQLEGTVQWRYTYVGDSAPVTDKDGNVYRPEPLVLESRYLPLVYAVASWVNARYYLRRNPLPEEQIKQIGDRVRYELNKVYPVFGAEPQGQLEYSDEFMTWRLGPYRIGLCYEPDGTVSFVATEGGMVRLVTPQVQLRPTKQPWYVAPVEDSKTDGAED